MSIASEIARIQSAKADLATSIANKGVTVPANATLDDYAALVDSIQTGGGGTLPSVIEVEYLQSDGSAYINTGIKVSSAIQFDISIYTTDDTKLYVFGGRKAFNDSHIGVILNDHVSNKHHSWRWGNKTNVGGTTFINGDVRIHNMTSKNIVAINNDTITVDDSSFTSTYNIHLWGNNNAGSQAEIPLNMRLKSAKFYQNSEMVRDYIPVRVGSVGYLYDKISGQLFGNAGTGNFILGSDA